MSFPPTLTLGLCVALMAATALGASPSLQRPAAPPVVETKTPEELLKQARETADQGNRAEAIAICSQVILSAPNHRNAMALRGRYYSELRQDAKAVGDFSAVLKLDPQATGIYQLRGWSQFRLGNFKEAIADFDKVIERRPSEAPEHWRRGIALYYAGRYDDGRKQFELHQTVNAHDVENAAWHFLCVARLSGLAKARASLITIEGDARVPMKEVHALFAGKATSEEVLAAARAGDPSSEKLNDSLFFAHLYLGLYFEATGDALKAREHIVKAASGFKSDHAMGDVARVHAEVLKRSTKK